MTKINIATAAAFSLLLATPTSHATTLEQSTQGAVSTPASVRLGGNTGSATYAIPIGLPAARGRFQPSLALAYSSNARQGSAGYGWSIPLSYVEVNERATPGTDGNDRTQVWMSMQGSRQLLMQARRDGVLSEYYVPEISAGYLRAKIERSTSETHPILRVLAWDGVGTTYEFSRQMEGAQRFYLARVTDAHGNDTAFSYDMTLGLLPRLTGIAYNFSDALGTRRYANRVELTYGGPRPAGVLVEAGSVVRQGKLLSAVVVTRETVGGRIFELAKWALVYAPTMSSGRIELASVEAFAAAGGPPPRPSRTTSFTYAADTLPALAAAATQPAIADSLGLLVPTAEHCSEWFGTTSLLTNCNAAAAAALIDLDGDHQPDRVWSSGGRLVWQRNLTLSPLDYCEAGDCHGGLRFAGAALVPGSEWSGRVSAMRPTGEVADDLPDPSVPDTQYAEFHVTTARMVDIDGDGRLDLVSIDPGACPGTGNSLAVRFARGSAAQAFHFEAPACMDTSAVQSAWVALTGVTRGFGFEREVRSAIGANWFIRTTYSDVLDVTGDGIADFVLVDPATGTWSVFPGYLNSDGHWAFSSAVRHPPRSPSVPGVGIRQLTSEASSFDLVDVNGDGLPDRVWADGFNWFVDYNNGRTFQRAPEVGVGPDFASGQIGAKFLQDLSRDGWPEKIEKGTSASCQWSARIGQGSGGHDAVAACIPRPTCGAIGCATPTQDYQPRSQVGLGASALTGYNGQWIDMNADGVPDYVVTEASGLQVWYPGGIGAGSVWAPPPGTLISTTAPTGIQTDLSWAPSSQFDSTPLGIFKAVLTGTREHDATRDYRTITYGYLAGQGVAPSWDEPTRLDQLGFLETTAVDSVSGLLQRTHWGTNRAFAGHADLVETTVLFASPSEPFHRVTRTASVCPFEADPAATSTCTDSPSATSFPAIVYDRVVLEERIQGGITLRSKHEIISIDAAGNVHEAISTPDTQTTASSHGERRVQTQAFYPPVPAPWEAASQTTCKNCPTEMGAKSFDGASTLSWRKFHYDAPTGQFEGTATIVAGDLNFVEDLASTGTYEVAAKTSYAADGLPLQTIRFLPGQCRPLVVTTREYDELRLAVTRETVSDSLSVVITDHTIDPMTGRTIASTFPHRPNETGAVSSAVAYDAWGRMAALGTGVVGPDADGTYTVTGLLGSTEYQLATTATPGIVTSRRYATAIPGLNATRWGALPPSFNPERNDVTEAKAYFDVLGRPLYQASRLGVGGTLVAEANITAGGSGWLISGLTAYDVQSRPWRTLDPFFATSDQSPVPAQQPMAHLVVRDWYGRVTCSISRPGGTDAQLGSEELNCQSNDAPGPAYRRATRATYGAETFEGRDWFTVASWPTWRPPLQPAKSYLDASGAALVSFEPEQSARRDSIVDLVEGSSTQLTTAGGKALRVKTWVDKKGRVVRQADDSATGPGYDQANARVRVQQYLPGGQLKWVGMNPESASDLTGSLGVEYVYGSLGRLAAQVDWEGGAAKTQVAQARYRYDTPYASDGYPNTFGHLASATTWEPNGSSSWAVQTTIAFGYDAQGRTTRRDQWFASLGSAAPGESGRSRVDLAYGFDGRVLATTMASAALGAVTFTYGYDTAGRQVQVTQGAAMLWQVMGDQDVKFDALGRAKQIELDGAHLLETHTYDATTGLETAFGSWLRPNLATPWTGATALYDARSLTYEGGQLKSMEELVGGTKFEAAYDTNGRLTQSKASAASNLSSMVLGLAQRYLETYSHSLDQASGPSLGNLTKVARQEWDVNGTPMPGRTDLYNYSPGKADLLQSLTHSPGVDAVGTDAQRRGLITQAPGGGVSLTLEYDTQNRLKAIKADAVLEESLSYDAMGGLARRSLPGQNAFRYHVGELMTVEVKGGVTTAWAHVFAGGQRVASVWGANAGTQALYYHRDRLGSVVATTTAGGGEGVQYRYDVYGALVAQKGAETAINASDLGYTGGLRLSRGLVHLRARVYSPTVRGFVQADNVDSQRYAYTGGDPVNFVDPSGHAGAASLEVKCTALQPSCATQESEKAPDQPSLGGLLLDLLGDGLAWVGGVLSEPVPNAVGDSAGDYARLPSVGLGLGGGLGAGGPGVAEAGGGGGPGGATGRGAGWARSSAGAAPTDGSRAGASSSGLAEVARGAAGLVPFLGAGLDLADAAREGSVGGVVLAAAFLGLDVLTAGQGTLVRGMPKAAKFAQMWFREGFSAVGRHELSKIAGKSIRTIEDLAAAIRGGLDPGKLPVNYVVREGNVLIHNTRTAVALERAGVPRSAWNAINRTGERLFEDLVSGQLERNLLGSAGTPWVFLRP